VSDQSLPGKRVTWAELFFDLVLVLGIIQVSTLLGEHHQWWGIGRAMIMLVSIYITWVALTLQTLSPWLWPSVDRWPRSRRSRSASRTWC